MKILVLLFISVFVITSCKTSKEGCAGARFSGERYKSTKFKWE